MVLDPDEKSKLLNQPGMMSVPATVRGFPAFVLKVEKADAESFRRPGIIVGFLPGLFMYRTGAAIRLYTEFMRKGETEFSFEAILNPGDQADRTLLRLFTTAGTIDFHIFDMDLNYVFTKRIEYKPRFRAELRELLVQALNHLTMTTLSLDWEQTRQQVEADTSMGTV